MTTCKVCGDPDGDCWGAEMDRQAIYTLDGDRAFCPKFESEMRVQIESAETVAELRRAIADYYEFHVTGGDCHIVLDDYNYADHSVRFCIENAETTEGKALAEKLLGLSLEDRAAANDWQFCKCGHAMSLHHYWDPSGSWGSSRSGSCDSPTCDCTNAECVEERPLTR